MRTQSLSLLTALTLSGLTAIAQIGSHGSSPRGSYSAPSYSTPSSSGSSGGSYNSAPSRGTYNTDSKTTGSSGSSNTGSSGSGSSSGSGTSYSGDRNSGSSGSSSSGSGSSNSSYNNNNYNYNGGYYNNNNGYYNNSNYSTFPAGTGSSTSGSGSSVSSNGSSASSNYTSSLSPDQMRNFAKQDIRKALAQFDRSSQQYTVSGTTPSTVTGLGGTRMNINPADLVTADGQPVSGDINVELKELDSPEKMALAGAPTMSNGDVLISGGSYYFGLTSGGQQLRLADGKTMEVQLPQTVNDPDMEVYMGEMDGSGNINWQPTGKPLTGLGQVRSNTGNSGTGNSEGTPAGNDTRPLAGNETNGGTPAGNDTRPGSGNGTGNGTNNGGGVGNGAATAYYNPTRINSLGWVNADKGNRGGCKMFVEVEGVDPTTTQVFIMYKDVKTLVEGKPEQGFSSNKFVFENIPANQPVKIVAVSKAFGTVYAGQMEAKTKARAKFTLPMERSTDSEAADMFKTK